MNEKRKKIVVTGLAIFGAVGFLGPLLFTLYSIFTGQEVAQVPVTATNPNDQTQALKQQIEGYQAVLKREPNNPTALGGLAQIYIQSGRVAEALPLVERLAASQPGNPQVQGELAQLYLMTGQISKAEAVYDRQLKVNKNDLNALVGKAQLRQVLGDSKGAKQLLDQAEKAAPTDLKPRVKQVAEQILKPPATVSPGSTPAGASRSAPTSTPADQSNATSVPGSAGSRTTGSSAPR